MLCNILTVAGGEEVLKRRSADLKAGHGVTFAVEILKRAHWTHVEVADSVVTQINVRQSLEHAEEDCLFSRQHQPIHPQIELLHVSHLGQSVGVQLLNLCDSITA